MRIGSARANSTEQRGAILVIVLMTITFMVGITYAFFTIAGANHRETKASADLTRTRYLAEAAVIEGIAAYRTGGRNAAEQLEYPREFGGATYSLQVEWGEDDVGMNDELVRMVGTGQAGEIPGAIEVLCRVVPGDDSPFGVSARTSVTMDSNASIDSYDSSLGSYASQLSGSWNGVDYANTDAPVRSNGSIDLDSNSTILGDAAPGPGDSVSLSGSSVVTGSTTPLSSPITFTTVKVPTVANTGSISRHSGTLTIPPGDYNYSHIHLDSNAALVIEGPSTVVVRNMTLDSNTKLAVDTTGGPVSFYVTGRFEMNSYSAFAPTSGDPADNSVFITGAAPDVIFDSNVSFAGVLYAPDRPIQIQSNSQLWGAVSGQEIAIRSGSAVHFDQNLMAGNKAGEPEVEVLCWRATTPPN